MEIFVSWSGKRSLKIAEGLRDWLPRVIQQLKPWLSADDIERGARWRSEVTNRLSQSRVGIFCLTPENRFSPWMHFEAGAISKNPTETLVCTYLYGLGKSDVRDPLGQFQHTLAEKEETRELVYSVNHKLESGPLDVAVLDDTFERFWPDMAKVLESVPELEEVEAAPKRQDSETMGEILSTLKVISQRLDSVQSHQRRPEGPPIPIDRIADVLRTTGVASSSVLGNLISARQFHWCTNCQSLIVGDTCPACGQTFFTQSPIIEPGTE